MKAIAQGAGRRARVLTLAAACLALFAIFLDNTIVNVAIPAIQQDLGSAPGQLEWVVNAYVVAFAGLVLLGGKLGDRFGRRRARRSSCAPGRPTRAHRPPSAPRPGRRSAH